MAMNVGSLFATLSLDSSKFSRGLGEAAGSLSLFRERIGVVTRGVGQMGVVIAAVLATTGVNAAKSFEEALIPVGTLVGRNTEQFAELEHGIKELLKTTPTKADDLGVSTYWILSAGIRDTNEALNVLTVSTKLSAAGLGTVEESAKLITSAMNAFKDQNISAQQAAELLFGAVQTGKTTIKDLAGGFGLIAPLADAAGVSMNDLLASVTAMTNVGETASEAFSGMRGLLSNILQPTKEATETAKRLGIQFNVSHLQAVGFGQFMDEIRQKAGGNAEAITSLVGSIRGMNVAFGLTGGEAEKFQENLTGIAEAGTLLNERATEVNTTTSRQMTILRNRVNIALEEMGRKLLNFFVPKLMMTADWIEANWPKITQVFHDVAEYIKGILEDMFGPALERLKPKLEEFVNWVRDHWPQISKLAGEVADFISDVVAPAIGSALDWLIGQGGRFADWFAKNVWPIVQHAAEVAWDWLSTDGVRLAKEGWEGIRRAAEATWDWMSTDGVQIAKQVAADTVDAFNWVRTHAPRIWNDVREDTAATWHWLRDNVGPILAPVGQAIMTMWEDAKNWTVAHWSETKQFLADAATIIVGAWQAVKLIWSYIGADILQMTKDTWTGIKMFLQAMWDIIRGLFHAFASLLRGDWDGVWEGLRTSLEGVWELMKTVVKIGVDSIYDTVSLTIHALGAPWMIAWNAMKDNVLVLWNDLNRDVQGKLAILQTIVLTGAGWIRDRAVEIWNELKKGFTDALQTMNDLGGPILDALRGGFDFVRGGVDWLRDRVEDLIGWIEKIHVPDLPGWIKSTGGFLSSTFGAAEGLFPHAEGGVFTVPHLGLVAESGPEAILPLNNPRRTNEILRALGGSGGSSSPRPQVTVVIVASPEAAMAYVPREAKGQAQDAILNGRRY